MSNSSTLNKIIESIKEIVTMVTLIASPEGISLQTMDESYASLINLQLNQSGFLSYKCDEQVKI